MRFTLIALQLVCHTNNIDCNSNVEEAINLNAESYTNFFEEIFELYCQSFLKWVVFFVGNNIALNLKIACLCGKPNIGFTSHKLNVEVNYMFKQHSELKITTDAVYVAMTEAKTKSKNAAILCNLTDCKPTLDERAVVRQTSNAEAIQSYQSGYSNS